MIENINATAAGFEADVFQDLENLVNVNSNTANAAGLKDVGRMIMDLGGRLGFDLTPVYLGGDKSGQFHLLCDQTGGSDRPFYGIIGHFDTVHLPESPFNRLTDQGDTLTGPGVQDMKSGIVSALYSLAVVKKVAGLESLPVKMVFNCDEETGSMDSRNLIQREIAGAAGAFVFEGRSDKDHAVITARKGIIMGRMKVAGKASHAGGAPELGINAVVEAAHKVLGLDKLNDLKAGTSVNVGTITGGEVANQIPDFCKAEIDVRFTTPEARDRVTADIRRILDHQSVAGTKTSYELVEARPPMVCSAATKALLEKYFDAAAQLGVPSAESSCGGVSDANLTAAIGVPSLDALGPEGDYCHTDQEYVVKASVMNCIRVSALFLSGLLS